MVQLFLIPKLFLFWVAGPFFFKMSYEFCLALKLRCVCLIRMLWS